MKAGLILSFVVALVLAGIIALGPIAHAFLPHAHSANEAVTSVLHSALRHEDKKLADMVPAAPLLLIVIAFVLAVAFPRAFAMRAHDSRARALTLLRRGVLPYRRFV